MNKLILSLFTVVFLSACQSTTNLEVEYIKARGQAQLERNEAMKAVNKYNYEAQRFKQHSSMLQAELERLLQLDEALQRAIQNSNCPVEI